MTGKAIGLELNQGYVGQPSRQAPVPEIFTRPAYEKLNFGTPVKIDANGKYAKFVAGTDTADKFAGIVTRGVQQATVYTSQNGETGYDKDLPCAVMERGYIMINVGSSTPTPNGKVYVTNGASTFTATPTSNTEIPNLKFTTGKKDGNNNVEVKITELPVIASSATLSDYLSKADAQTDYQAKLTAGDFVDITDNTITTTYTAGTGIAIDEHGEISAT